MNRKSKESEFTIDKVNNRELDYTEHFCLGLKVQPAGAKVNRTFLVLDSMDDRWSQPVFSIISSRLVGLAIEGNEDYSIVIPAEFLSRYIDMVQGPAPYAGFPSFDSFLQTNSNRPLARYLGGKPRGIIITSIPWGSTLAGSVRPRDVILTLDGHEIDSDGYYDHDRYGRLMFHAIADAHDVGDVIKAKILRAGQELEIDITLKRWRSSSSLIPWRRDEEAPPFVIRGGLIFRELDGDYLRSFGDHWRYSAPAYLSALYEYESKSQSADHRRVVILAGVLPDAHNIGYHDIEPHPVLAVNGHRINGLLSLADAFRQPSNGFHTVSLAPGATRRTLVLDAATLPEAQARILSNYAIPRAERLPDRIK